MITNFIQNCRKKRMIEIIWVYERVVHGLLRCSSSLIRFMQRISQKQGRNIAFFFLKCSLSTFEKCVSYAVHFRNGCPERAQISHEDSEKSFTIDTG